MNKFVEVIDWAATAIGAMMSLNLAVVALILGFHLEEAPRYRAEMPLLLMCILTFALLGGSGAFAALAMRRGKAFRWPAQIAVLGCIALVAMFVSDYLRS